MTNSAQEQEAKAADEEGRLERTVLAYREDDEGDLFGVRALEKGFTGGVYQSRPNTPQVSRTASLVIPKKVRIPYGKPNLSRSTIALDLGGTPASGSAEQGSLARKNGREGFDRSGSTSIAGSSAETSRSNTPEESYSRSCSSVKHNHTPSGSSLDYDMVEANRNLDGSSGSTPPNLPLPARPENQFMIKIQKPEYPCWCLLFPCVKNTPF